MNATEVDPEWVKRLAKTLRDGGYAFRKGHNCTIEVKSQVTDKWIPLALPNGSIYRVNFASELDRNQIYNALRALAIDTPRADWKTREQEVHDALADGHPNPEGYLEWWYSENPKPTP